MKTSRSHKEPNYRLKPTEPRVTPLAEERKRRATRLNRGGGPTSDVMTSTWGHMEIVAAETEFLPGEKMTLTAASSCTAFGAVFEDDGDTGYFYALDTSNPDHQILDALLVYNVIDVTDRQKSSRAEVVWSADGLRVILRINGRPHAAFDFAKGRGYCRTNFPPPPAAGFSSESHAWSDDVLAFFG